MPFFQVCLLHLARRQVRHPVRRQVLRLARHRVLRLARHRALRLARRRVRRHHRRIEGCCAWLPLWYIIDAPIEGKGNIKQIGRHRTRAQRAIWS